jgi:TolB-like protein/Flp pilus assembly protein TadD
VARADEVLRGVIEAVADGQSVDWPLVESTPMSSDERALLDQLKVLDGVHRLHRSGGLDPSWGGGMDAAHTMQSPIDGTAETRNITPAFAPNRWGPLEVRGVLGAGGFGIVYRAWDPNLACEVALKVLVREPSGSGETVIREARLLARVRHQNIVSIFGADRWNGQIGLWMEFVRGRTLKDVVRQQGTFGAREAAVVGLALTRALAAVHGAGLVHRDVKPHNVMREESGRIVLMDFGAVLDLEERHPRSSRHVGTPLYMAPELFDHHQPSPQSDLYALGILLYYLVTAAYPVDGNSPEDVRRKHVEGRRRHLRDARADLPTEFVRIVERAIDPDTQRRYRSAGDLEADLARFVVHDERIPDRRPSARRFPAWAAVAAALVVVLAATGVALEIYRNAHRATAVPMSTTLHSLVVLPLRNASGDAAQDYFVDGMTELLTADLSGVSVLRVIGDSSASRYRGTQKSGADIGRELKVDAVVEGSVARSGNRVRVTLQVVHAGTNLSVWGSSFEREAEDAFALQAEIARAIVAQLKGALTRGEQRRLSQTYVAAAAAQDLYLRARYSMHTYNRDQVAEARVLLERAVQIDGNYALAWASLARCYALLQEYGLLSPDESRRLGSTAATTAISLDPDMFEAHSTLAEALFKFDWNWDEADAHYRRALEANPSFSLARWQYARFLSAAGRVDQAVAEALRAEQSDPNSIDVKGTVAMMLFYKRQYAASVDKTTEALALDPRQPGPHFIRGRALAGLGRLDDAAHEIEDTVRMTGNQSGQLAELGRVYALAGRRGDAATILARLAGPQDGADAFVAAQDAAYVQLGLGMRSEALSGLERAVDQRSERVLWIRVDPRLDPLRADPRFQKLVERIGGLSSAP